jgi:serine/threonine-protein kinase RsbW
MTDSEHVTVVPHAALRLSAIADARTVARFRYELSQWLRENFTLDPLRYNDVLLAVNEALTNAVEFAYGGRAGAVTVQAHHAVDDSLVVDVADRGSWRHTDPATRSNTRGRGIPLMRALADQADISRFATGTHVRLQFNGCALVTAHPFADAV